MHILEIYIQLYSVRKNRMVIKKFHDLRHIEQHITNLERTGIQNRFREEDYECRHLHVGDNNEGIS